MTKYVVYDNEKPAVLMNSRFKSWHNCEFDTFEEARDYAISWLGVYGKGANIEIDNPYDYSGHGDTITILKEVR